MLEGEPVLPEASVENHTEVPSPISLLEALNSSPLPRLDYYETDELTAKPQALGEPPLETAAIANIVASGRIVLVLRINAQGEVVDAAVDFSDLPDIFSQSAVKAFQNLHFVPGELNGQKVSSVLRIEVHYDDAQLPLP